jgi:hypothetical protein
MAEKISIKFRKLRIAWSVAWGLTCVLLIVLWVRSYFIRDTAWLPASKISVEMNSLYGRVVLVFPFDRYVLGNSFKTFHEKVITQDTSRFQNSILRLVVIRQPNLTEIQIPFWCLILACLALVAAPWLHCRRRFSLRTLVIATTLVAVGLGLVAWVARK